LKSVDFVIPLAAIVGAPACDRDPELASRVNKSSILDMFKLVQREQRILMPTTNSAYGSGDAQNYCDEESPLNPISLYAKDKVEVESHLMQLHGATSFRLATVFGMSPRMRVDLLVNDFVRKAILDGYVILFESNFKRNYIHVKDVVKAFQMAIKDPDKFAGEIFNVGLSSANVSKKELCERIKKFIPNFVFTESQLKSDPDQRNYIVSNKKLEKLGFRPEFSLDDGIMELIKGIPMLQLRPYTNL
jgi:nucleoside-diphosphate-sugar epimerase